MKFIRLNIDYCYSYLIVIISTCVLHFVDGGLNHCGQDLVHIQKYTDVRITNDGFCSTNGGPSCCQSWNGLVNPGLELLFGKWTYMKFNQLNDLIRNIKKSLGDLECHKNTTPIHTDILTSIDILQDINWIALLNNTFRENQCGLELAKLFFCSSNYCLHNQTVQPSQNCHGQCLAILQSCVQEPFSNLSRNWKRAIGSLSTSLRILAAKTPQQCSNDKSVLDAHVMQLHERRDPVSWFTGACNSYGFALCFPETNNLLFSKGQDVDKSLANHGVKLQSIVSSLEKYWPTQQQENSNGGLSSSLDQDDLLASSFSGSGWGSNNGQYTDDEDLLNGHMYGSGSGHGEEFPDLTSGGDETISISTPHSPTHTSSKDSPDRRLPDKNRNEIHSGGSSGPRHWLLCSSNPSSRHLYPFILIQVLIYYFSQHLH